MEGPCADEDHEKWSTALLYMDLDLSFFLVIYQLNEEIFLINFSTIFVNRLVAPQTQLG